MSSRNFEDLPPLSGGNVAAELTASRSVQPIRQFSHHVTEGPDAGQRFLSQPPEAVVGTHESASWRLQDQTLSRFHCALSVKADGRVRIQDLGSRNGRMQVYRLLQEHGLRPELSRG